LVKSILDDTPPQVDLINFKMMMGQCGDDIGRSGIGYRRVFMKKNANKIVSEKYLKYEIDRVF